VCWFGNGGADLYNMPDGTVSIPIQREQDAFAAKTALRNLARIIGFSERESEELLLVVSELASNLIKHAHGGQLAFKVLEDAENRKGIEIESTDDGPGMADPELALTDGYSTAGSLGYGLGTVNRLADEMEVASKSGVGSRIICRRWTRVKKAPSSAPRLDFGVVTRARGNAGENGDAFVVKRWNGQALVGLIDGLGHGPFAARAAAAARGYIETHFDQPLGNILRGTDRACRATRGAVVGLAALYDEIHLSFSGIGNIEARIIGSGKPVAALSVRGIVGAGVPSPQITEHSWGPDHLLVMHSDGLRHNWRWTEFRGLERESAAVIARNLFQALATADDDATILVMKSASA